MARHKDIDWQLPEGASQQWESLHAALLMDIRDELKKLNSLLHCQNFVRLPRTLNEIRLNTNKKRRKK